MVFMFLFLFLFFCVLLSGSFVFVCMQSRDGFMLSVRLSINRCNWELGGRIA